MLPDYPTYLLRVRLMTGTRLRWATLLTGLALTASAQFLAGQELYNKTPAKGDTVPMPKPAEVQTLTVHPTSVTLKGVDDSQQLILTAQLAGRLQDLTADIKYSVADPKVARVTTSGRVIPLNNGKTTI